MRVDSGAFTELPISLPGDGSPHEGEATPGELLAAAYGSFFLEALAELLLGAGTPARELVVDVSCEISLVTAGHQVSEVDVSVHGRGERIERGAFEGAAQEALESCRISVGTADRIPFLLRAHLLDPVDEALPDG